MRRRPNVWSRVRPLTAHYADVELERLLVEMAKDEGWDPEEVLADHRALDERMRKAGARSLKQQMEFIAADIGVPVEQFRAEVEADVAKRRR